jgi:hypothetical protein
MMRLRGTVLDWRNDVTLCSANTYARKLLGAANKIPTRDVPYRTTSRALGALYRSYFLDTTYAYLLSLPPRRQRRAAGSLAVGEICSQEQQR